MAEYFVHPRLGSEAGAGTELDPWLLVPGTTGSHTVTSGDIVNVRNGETQVLLGSDRFVPFTGVTYRGYGMAANVLQCRAPIPGMPWIVFEHTIVREAGVHEGMWVIDGRNKTSNTVVLTGTRSNIVIEDMHVLGTPGLSANAVEIGSTSTPGSNNTLRRCRIQGGGKAGYYSYSNNNTCEWLRVDGPAEDCMLLRSGSFNGERAGSIDRFENIDLRDPNTNQTTGLVTGVLGDAFQQFSSAATGAWHMGGSVTIKNVYVRKYGTAKQAFLLLNAANAIDTFHIDGGPGGAAGVMIGHLNAAGQISIKRGFVNGYAPVGGALGFVRFDALNTSPPVFGWGTGSSVLIEGVIASGATNLLSMDWPFSSGPFEHNGSVTVRHCTHLGVNTHTKTDVGGADMGATISLASARTTFGPAFALVVESNALLQTGKPHITMPAGTENDARFVFRNNAVQQGATFKVGSTSYDIGAFQAAHSQASANVYASESDLGAGYRPRGPLRKAGKQNGSSRRRDMSRVQDTRPPSIGAMALATRKFLKQGAQAATPAPSYGYLSLNGGTLSLNGLVLSLT